MSDNYAVARQSILNRIDAQIAAVTTEIDRNHGKRGNAERRAQLDTLRSKRSRADLYHYRAQAQLHDDRPGARSAEHVRKAQIEIRAAAFSHVERGYYDELVLTNTWRVFGYASAAYIINRYPTHPRLRKFAAWREAHEVLQRAIDYDLLDDAGIVDAGSSARRRRWSAVNHDIYGYSHDGKLICVQQRESESDGRYTKLHIRYFVTDGETAIEIGNGRKQIIKRAAAADPSPDSPLRALRNDLPAVWQEMIDPTPVKLSAPLTTTTGYKLLEMTDDGALRSLWSADYYYTLNRRSRQAVRSNHAGGLYYYLTPDECRKLTETNWGRTIGNYAVVRCEVSGRTLTYASGKRAATYLRPIEIVETIAA